jgi:sporulation protein YlmC with PRC-barrel domain
VMVEGPTAVTEGGESLSKVVETSPERNVLGNDVLTDGGRRLGEVIDVVIEVTSGDVVGYELRGDKELQAHAGQPLLIPIPATLAVSGSVLMVPAAVEPYIRDDLSGFGAAVEEFRGELPQAEKQG